MDDPSPNKQVQDMTHTMARAIFDPNTSVDDLPIITHSEFLAGLKDKTVAVNILDEPFLLRGSRKTMFAIYVLFYTVGPLVVIPICALIWHRWLFLLGIPVSYVGSLIAMTGFRKALASFLLIGTIVSWISEGFSNITTFLLLSGLWGNLTFLTASAAQSESAMQAIMDNPELYNEALIHDKIRVWRWTDMAKNLTSSRLPNKPLQRRP